MKITKFYQKKINQNYVMNILDARALFEQYLNTDINNTLSESANYIWFRDSLKAQHRAMTERGYKGYTKTPVLNRPVINALRDEPEFHINLQRPCLKKEWYNKELKKYKLKFGDIIRPTINGIHGFAWHRISNTHNGLSLELPANENVKYYLILMSNLMLQIKALIKDRANGNMWWYCRPFQGTLINLLGHYIHLFVIGHPFEKVNFSLCMMQVNHILDKTLGKSVYHEYLDFKCFMNDTNTIIDEFSQMVRKSRR